ncbi:DHH family phosphoesterase [Thalassomonas actiniarum]|uniref:DHH family phosphoesterase n=1 Tax=Thalassomonas actiniarum TaxID=485447 RepID=A0AAE9YVY8_9GAMM|nr:DHH family phosphoesterase [Thalassomonas actiniarum]WDE00557.1 DHH family phosphoesterase [Thalassomonas actiniarum]
MHFDVFNGDADGIIALVQLRLAQPKDSHLITGVKRDISLLKQVRAQEAESATVLDISLEKNSEALQSLLAHGVEVLYVDHHRAGDIPRDDKLKTIINTDANTCTSLLVNELLQGKYANWAIAAAFGDNMKAAARTLAQEVGLTKAQQELLEALGIYINYNGYGRDLDDLHFHPAELFKLLVEYSDPLELVADSNSVFATLQRAYQQDMAKAESARVLFDGPSCKVVLLADEAWARRVSGVFGNELANASPDKAHAVLTLNADLSYTVSVRAPLNNKQGADNICVQFPTGGGRAAAAGINHLPQEKLEAFIEAVSQYYLA